MPNVLGHGKGHSARHVPTLSFDTNHLFEGGTGGSGDFTQVLLRDWTLNLGSGGAVLKVCSDIVNLRPVTGRPVLPALLEGGPHSLLTSRVTLEGGWMSGVAKGSCWEWDPRSYRRLASDAEWTIVFPDLNVLEVALKRFDPADDGENPLLPLHPINDGGTPVVNLLIDHLPPDEMRPEPGHAHEPETGFYPEHFIMYFDLFGPQTPIRLPRYGSDGDCPTGTGDCPQLDPRGENTYNCMLASAWAIAG